MAKRSSAGTVARGSTDRFRRRSPVRPFTSRLVGASAVIWGAAYLIWRLLATGDGASPFLFWPLLMSELIGFSSLVALVSFTWPDPQRTRTRRVPQHSADILITTLAEPIDHVRASLLGARALAGAGRIVVSDDSDRTEMRDLATRFGATYVHRPSSQNARAGNVNAVVPNLRAELVLMLTAGDVPMPDLLTATDRYFDDPKTAVVMCGYSDAPRSAITHSPDDRHELALWDEIILPNLDHRRVLPWLGGPSIVRRDALAEVGGLARDTQTPEFQTGIRFRSRGLLVRFHAETLCETWGPESAEALMALRQRSALGYFGVMRTADSPMRARGLDLRSRLTHLTFALRTVSALRLVVALGVLVATLLTGAVPLTASISELTFIAVPALVLAAGAPVIVGRGRLELGDRLQFELRYLGIYLQALIRGLGPDPQRYRYAPTDPRAAAGQIARENNRVLRVTLGVIAAALAFRLVHALIGNDPGGLGDLAFTVAVGAAVAVGIQGCTVLGLLQRHVQRRRRYRVLVDLNAEVAGERVNVLDINPTGLGIESKHPLSYDEPLMVTVEMPDASGRVQRLELAARVRNARPIPDRGTWRVGTELDPLDEAESDILEWFCFVSHPFRSLRTGVEQPLSNVE